MTNQFPDATKMVLSPAQVVRNVFSERYELCGPFDDNWLDLCLAASLSALVSELGTRTKSGAIILNGDAVLAIAVELEGQPIEA